MKRPDIQLYFQPLSYTRAPVGTRPLMSPDTFPGFLLGFSPCRPASRGEIVIRSADPLAPPAIRPNYLADEADMQAMIDGMKYLWKLADQPALQTVIAEQLKPGTDDRSDEAIRAHVRENSWTVFHPCSTCRMGEDPGQSVVDPRLRVHGIGRLRVVDASVFPCVTSANTNAPAIMVADRAADLILEDAR
jgi:choline dehydrogenase